MTSHHRRALPPRARSKLVVLSAAVTLALSVVFGSGQAPAVAQIFQSSTTTTTLPTTTSVPTTTTTPSEWDGSHWTAPTADGATVADGVFSGVFTYQPGTPRIDHVELDIAYTLGYSHTPECGTAPGPSTHQAPSTRDPSPGEPDSMKFLFEIAFRCNGSYDATATATLEGPSGQFAEHDLTLRNVRVAVPPQQPASILATDNGNQSVTIKWEPPTDQPPDLVGYRVSRREASAASVDVLTDTTPDARSFDDTTIPPGGGSYFYRVETLRSSPIGVLASVPIATSDALVVGGTGGGRSGGSVGGTPVTADPGSGGTGVQHFDDTLPADEGELGAGDPLANVPGGDTVQRFVGEDGAGLIKPFGAALNIGVWASLLLFLTRRAARAERLARSEVEFLQ